MFLPALINFCRVWRKVFEHAVARPSVQATTYSSVGKASTFGAGDHGFKSRPLHFKGVKNGTSSSLPDAPIEGVVLGGWSKAGK